MNFISPQLGSTKNKTQLQRKRKEKDISLDYKEKRPQLMVSRNIKR